MMVLSLPSRVLAAAILLLGVSTAVLAQSRPNEPASKGATIDPESGTAEGESASENDDAPRAGQMPSGQSGLPLPRFASLRANEVNLRTGPGVRYPVDWVFHRRGLPVEIVAEFGTWRKIRDEEGTEGWVHRSMLSGKRTAMTLGRAGGPAGGTQILHRQPEADSPAVARVEPGVVASVLECNGPWCRVEAQGFRGWLPRSAIWGVKANEKIDD